MPGPTPTAERLGRHDAVQPWRLGDGGSLGVVLQCLGALPRHLPPLPYCPTSASGVFTFPAPPPMSRCSIWTSRPGSDSQAGEMWISR